MSLGGPVCRVCGCTEAEGCPPEGCAWAEPDLCTACQEILAAITESDLYRVYRGVDGAQRAMVAGAEAAIRIYRDRLVRYAHGEG